MMNAQQNPSTSTSSESEARTETQPLQEQEARIRDGLRAFWQVGDALKVIRESHLYTAAGFSTFEAYCVHVWHFTDRRARYLIDAATVYAFIQAAGTDFKPTRETQMRPITSLPPAQAVQAWNNASTQHNGNPTKADVQESKAEIVVNASPYQHVKQELAEKKIKPDHALALITSLDSCQPTVAKDMVRLDAHDPSLVREMNRIAGTDTYQTIAVSGHIQFNDGTGIEVKKAKSFDLRRMLDESRAAHIDANTQSIYVPLFPSNASKTIDQIRKYTSDEFLQSLFDAYQEQSRGRS